MFIQSLYVTRYPFPLLSSQTLHTGLGARLFLRPLTLPCHSLTVPTPRLPVPPRRPPHSQVKICTTEPPRILISTGHPSIHILGSQTSRPGSRRYLYVLVRVVNAVLRRRFERSTLIFQDPSLWREVTVDSLSGARRPETSTGVEWSSDVVGPSLPLVYEFL